MLGRIAGRYDLVALLGEGGMGVVYDAIHISTGRSVAVKILSLRGMTAAPHAVERFAREARTAGAISSKHIVQVLDAGTDPETGASFLAMEKLRGADLSTVVRPIRILPIDITLRIIGQACVGLAKAHEAGVVHRDIKFGNLFLAEGDDDEIVVKVLDFGIAKFVTAHLQETDTELTRTGTMIGSPQYMSPEQALGSKELDGRSDLWSLGIALYKLLSGRTPHQSCQAVGELIIRICSTPVPPIQDVAPWVPPEVARIVHRALRRRREERYETADAMLADIRALVPDLTIKKSMLQPLGLQTRAVVAARAELTGDRTTPVGSPVGPDPVPASDRTLAGVGVYGSAPPPPAERRRSRLSPIVLAVAATGVIVASWAFLRGSPSSNLTPAAAAVAVSATQTQPTPPSSKLVKLAVTPETALVMVDDQNAPNVGGFVELRGPIGSRHRVALRDGEREVTGDVVITEDGAFPSTLTLPRPTPANQESTRVTSIRERGTSQSRATKESSSSRRTPEPIPPTSEAPGFKIQKSFE